MNKGFCVTVYLMLKFNSKVQPDRFTLESIFSSEFVEVMEVQRGVPRHLCQANLGTDCMNTISHWWTHRVGTRIISYLPDVVTGWSYFEKQRLVFL